MPVLKAFIGGQWVDVSTAGADGAAGAPGPTVVSADAGNTAVLGSDSLLFVPSTAGDEVFVGPDDPYLTDPTGAWEVWVREVVLPPTFTRCPSESEPFPEITGTGTVTASNLIPGNSYTWATTSPDIMLAWTGTAYDAATKVADATGVLTWRFYPVTNQTAVTAVQFTVHDGATNADPVLYTGTVTIHLSPTSNNWAAGLQVGVAATYTAAGLIPGRDYELFPSNTAAVGIVLDPIVTADASGAASWPFTVMTSGYLQFDLFLVSPPSDAACWPLYPGGAHAQKVLDDNNLGQVP